MRAVLLLSPLLVLASACTGPVSFWPPGGGPASSYAPAPYDSVVVAPTYAGVRLSGSLAVLPPTGRVLVQEGRDVCDCGDLDSLGVEAAYRERLQREIATHLQSATGLAVTMPSGAVAPVRYSPPNRDSIRIPIPGQRIDTGGDAATYLLLLQQPTAYRELKSEGVMTTPGPNGMMMGSGAGRRITVTQYLRWVLWDNEAGRLVAMGTALGRSGSAHMFRSAEASQDALYRRLAEEIAAAPPFATE